MKMIVGLGNPGRRYRETRHNVGFEVAGLLTRHDSDGQVRERFQALAAEARIGDEKVLLLCPQTFMNLSGRSVRAAVDFFKLAADDLLVVCDDFNLPLGRIRIRGRGSDGGQKGLRDILRVLGTDEVARLRIGVGPLPSGWDPSDFVLSRFSRSEQPDVEEVVARSADAARCWAREGTEAAMNRYNAG